MRRTLIGLGALVVVALALVASVRDDGSSASSQRSSSATAVIKKATDRSRKAKARRTAARDAKRRLARLRLPPDARRVSGVPGGSGGRLQSPAFEPDTPNLIDLHAWWIVPGDPQAVLAWIKEHPPSGSELKIESSSGYRGVTTSWDIGFEWPPIKSISNERALLVTVTAGAGNETALRADSQAVWIVPRLLSERVPATVRFLDLSVGRAGEPQRSLAVANTKLVRDIAASINGLPVAQPGASSCSAMPSRPVTVRLVFRAVPDGPALAEAEQQEPAGGCNAMGLKIRGKPEPALEESWRVLQRLRGLLRRAQ